MNEDLMCELYQILGALNAPEEVLDQVYAAMAGEPLPHETLLPFDVWRPIETAPKDGTDILVVTESKEVTSAFFGTSSGQWRTTYNEYYINERVTHWTHLPIVTGDAR